MTTTSLARAPIDQADILAGNCWSGAGLEAERRVERLRTEAERHRLPTPASATGAQGLRRRVGHGLVHLGSAIQGVEPTGC